MNAKFVVTAERVFEQLRRGGVIADDPSDVRRVVIDLTVGEVARVYVERFADDSILGPILQAHLKVVPRD